MKSATIGSLSPEYVLLGMLAQKPAHGYDVHRRLSRDLNQVWHLRQSQIYNILNRLENQGDIRGTILEQDKLPDRRYFELTESGIDRYEQWLMAPSRTTVRAIRVEFTTRLYFAVAQDLRIAHKIVEEQIAETQQGLKRLINQQASIPDDQKFNKLGLDLRIRQIISILEWLDTILVSVEDG